MSTNGHTDNPLNRLISHRNFENVKEEVLQAIDMPYVSPSIIVCGPPKVGKTRLRDELVKEFRQESNLFPATSVVDIEIPFCATKGLGSLPTYIHRMMLAQLNDPYLTDMPIHSEQMPLFSGYEPYVRKFDSPSLIELRKQTLIRLETEKCKVVFVDMRSAITPLQQLTEVYDTVRYLQNLASDAQLPFVIFGNYDLIRNDEFLTEIHDKSQLIHFPRYGFSADHDEFVKILGEIEEVSPMELEFDLSMDESIQYLYSHSLGCIGRYIEIIQKAIKYAETKNEHTISVEALGASNGLPRALMKLNSYINLGEKMMNRSVEEWGELYNEIAYNFGGFKYEQTENENDHPQVA